MLRCGRLGRSLHLHTMHPSATTHSAHNYLPTYSTRVLVCYRPGQFSRAPLATHVPERVSRGLPHTATFAFAVASCSCFALSCSRRFWVMQTEQSSETAKGKMPVYTTFHLTRLLHGYPHIWTTLAASRLWPFWSSSEDDTALLLFCVFLVGPKHSPSRCVRNIKERHVSTFPLGWCFDWRRWQRYTGGRLVC